MATHVLALGGGGFSDAEEIAAGRLPNGFGIVDGALLHFVDGRLDAVISEVAGRAASRFELQGTRVVETRLDVRLLASSDV